MRWLEDIFEYIAQDNPDAAARTVQGIYEALPPDPPLAMSDGLQPLLSGDTERVAPHSAGNIKLIRPDSILTR